MTRKEAEVEAKKLNQRDPQWFCPLIPGPCRRDCVNFVMAHATSDNENKNGFIHDADDDSFYVDGWACSNACFIGSPMMSCGS